MKRAYRLFLATGGLALASRVVIACATDDTATPEVIAEDAAVEASVLPAPDAGDADAAVDAQVDATPRTCSDDGWCVMGLPEAGSYDASALPPALPGTQFALRAVWAAPDGNAWAVSSAGHIMHFDGAAWNVVTIATQPLTTVWGVGTTEIWVGGEQGLVLHGTIAGGTVSFTTVNAGITSTIAKITGNGTDVWMIPDGLNGSGSINRVFRLKPTKDGFTSITVPSPFTDSAARLRLSVLWTSGVDVWVAGYATTCVLPSPCRFSDELIALKYNGDVVADAGDARAAWTYVPLLRNYSYLITAATTGSDGVQMLAFRGLQFDDGFVARIASDPSKLDGGPGPDSGISDEGAYKWTQELAESFGSPTGIWATNQNDAYILGLGGTVRHYDGKAWQLVRLSRTSLTPVLSDLYAIDGVVMPDGSRRVWIVGDDVALQKKVMP